MGAEAAAKPECPGSHIPREPLIANKWRIACDTVESLRGCSGPLKKFAFVDRCLARLCSCRHRSTVVQFNTGAAFVKSKKTAVPARWVEEAILRRPNHPPDEGADGSVVSVEGPRLLLLPGVHQPTLR